jgi:hypothetical protein
MTNYYFLKRRKIMKRKILSTLIAGAIGLSLLPLNLAAMDFGDSARPTASPTYLPYDSFEAVSESSVPYYLEFPDGSEMTLPPLSPTTPESSVPLSPGFPDDSEVTTPPARPTDSPYDSFPTMPTLICAGNHWACQMMPACTTCFPIFPDGSQVADLGSMWNVGFTFSLWSDLSYSDTNVFRTHTGSIHMTLFANGYTPQVVRVNMFEAASGEQINSETLTLGQWGETTLSFSGLRSADTYYFTFDNVGQTTLVVTGWVSQYAPTYVDAPEEYRCENCGSLEHRCTCDEDALRDELLNRLRCDVCGEIGGHSTNGWSFAVCCGVPTDCCTCPEVILPIIPGDIFGTGYPSIDCAIEVFKYLNNLPSFLHGNDRAFTAALVTPESRRTGVPSMADVFAILQRACDLCGSCEGCFMVVSDIDPLECTPENRCNIIDCDDCRCSKTAEAIRQHCCENCRRDTNVDNSSTTTIVIIIVLPGDVLGRGEIGGVEDAIQILRYLVGLSSALDNCQAARSAASFTNGVEPDVKDAIALLRNAIGLPTVLNPGL